MGGPATQRRCTCLMVAAVVACSFDSGGVGGQGDALGDGDGSTTLAQPADTSSGGPVDPTQVSADGSSEGHGEADTTTTTTGTPADSSTGPATDDPCAVDNGGCDVDATCSADPSGEVAVCDCNDGFEGNGLACVVLPALATLRVEAECNISAFDSCTASSGEQSTPMVGEPGTLYVVTLWIRGVVETKSYDGGEADGLWHPDGDPGDLDLWNTTTLSIGEGPTTAPQTIRLNSGSSGGSSLVVVDMTHDVVIEAEAAVTLSISTIDGTQIRNHDDLVVNGIPPAPDAFDGQFLQIDATEIYALE